MYFTSQEKQAIVKVAAAMQAADGKSDPREFVLNATIFKKLEIGGDDFNGAKNLSLLQAASIIANMTSSEKEFISAFLGSIIVADGDIDDKEIALWRLLTSLCEFPTMSLSDATKTLQKYMK